MRVRLLPTDLKAIVLGSIEGVRGEITGNGQLLRTHFEDHPYVVAADGARLAQAVVNLLTNATRYTPTGGRIDVELAADDAFATLRVMDNGIGMSEELVQRAFDPFVQGDGSPGRSHRGLGIGLTLVRKIVTLHNGSITVESSPGRGTTFTLRLPLAHLAVAPEPAIADSAATRPPVATGEHRILIVDDNDDVAQTLASALSLLGYQVTTAADGVQAIETALRQQPDVVLLDLGMPGMDGYEVARRLREIPELTGMRVAAVTGYGQPKDRLATRELGFDEHFVKPVEAAQLASFIEGKPAPE
jgi:CheY-like chemotaxis protein/anti-sigma regulatory factor (Ser/Thr protein kinase)